MITIKVKWSDRPKWENYPGHRCETKEEIDSYINNVLIKHPQIGWQVFIDDECYWKNCEM